MIVRAGIEYAETLSEMGAETFIESHKYSAPQDEIDTYVKEKYNVAAIAGELADPANIYFVIMQEGKIAGFSKMMRDSEHASISLANTAKMDQIYLLNSFHGLQLGARLLQFNIEFSKSLGQQGMWLVVWIGNSKAIKFYEKFGFNIVKKDYFQLTETHISPCYIMLLDYK